MNLTDIMSAMDYSSEPAVVITYKRNNSMPAFPKETPVGMAYVPYQQWQNIYEPDVALERATIFKDLDKPFLGERAV